MDGDATGELRTEMAELPRCVGRHLGYTDWATITQEHLDAFAELTGDRNFIHVDPERARATPFKGTIAHGFLTLALIAPVTQRLRVTDASTSINYGLDRVRFPAPLPVGGQWRAGAEVREVSEISGGMQAKLEATVQARGSERPVVVAEFLVRYYA